MTSHCTYSYLQIIGQLGPSGVSGVHCDEDRTGGVQVQLGSLELKHVGAGADGSRDGQDLLGHHGQHLQVDPVELVETGPGAARRQTLESGERSGDQRKRWGGEKGKNKTKNGHVGCS